MKLFDAYIYSDVRSDADMSNLAWFDVEHVLTCAHAPKPFDTAEDLWQYFEQLIGPERDRLRGFGLEAHVAIGIHPNAVPKRAHYEIWRELPHLLSTPHVSALGELGIVHDTVQEWSLLERQLGLVAQLENPLPIVVSLSTKAEARTRRAWLIKLGECLRAHQLDPQLTLVQHIDWLTIDEAQAQGFVSGLSLSPFFLSTEQALRIIKHHDRRRIVVGSALRDGPVDVLALPKLAAALNEAGIDRIEIERLLYGNAKALFVRS